MSFHSTSAVNAVVYRQFKEFSGIKPKILTQGSNYVLIYQTEMKLSDGRMIKRILRVVADENGKVIKTTTSR